MKNTKKIISLVLAICMLASLAISASAANTVDASGGTGTSSVTLSSTADGSIGGDPAATKMNVQNRRLHFPRLILIQNYAAAAAGLFCYIQ